MDDIRPGEDIVLSDVDVLGSVDGTVLVNGVGSESLVAEGDTCIALLELHLLREGKGHSLFAHIEHLLNFSVGTVVLQTTGTRQCAQPEGQPLWHVLPKTDGGRAFPEFFDLCFVVCQKLLVIHDEERVSGNISWERREIHRGCRV